jgi:hypothetical protein
VDEELAIEASSREVVSHINSRQVRFPFLLIPPPKKLCSLYDFIEQQVYQLFEENEKLNIDVLVLVQKNTMLSSSPEPTQLYH